MHMQRQYRQSEANDEEGNQHSAHNGQQRADRPVVA
jgi:hypothetical protein